MQYFGEKIFASGSRYFIKLWSLPNCCYSCDLPNNCGQHPMLYSVGDRPKFLQCHWQDRWMRQCGTGKGWKRKANLSWGRLQKKNVWACRKAQMFGEAGRERSDLGRRLNIGWLRRVAETETFLFSVHRREAGGSWKYTFWPAVKVMILENFRQPVLDTVSEVVMGKWRCSRHSSSPQPERFCPYWEILWGMAWSWACLPFKGKPRRCEVMRL